MDRSRDGGIERKRHNMQTDRGMERGMMDGWNNTRTETRQTHTHTHTQTHTHTKKESEHSEKRDTNRAHEERDEGEE